MTRSNAGPLRRRATRLVLAVALALGAVAPSVALAQAEIILQIIIGLGMRGAWELTASDADRIQRFESLQDWDGLAQLATERIGEKPALPPPAADVPPGREARGAEPVIRAPDAATRAVWLVVRAGARRQQFDWERAIADYAAASQAVGGLPRADLNRALCEMALGRYDAAEQTLEKLTRYADLMWDAHYNLGVVRAVKGDLAGARRAQAALQSLNPVLANVLEVEFIAPPAETAPTVPAAPTTGDLALARAPGRLDDGRMSIDGRTLRLPPGEWVLVSSERAAVTIERPATWTPYAGVVEPDTTEFAGVAVATDGRLSRRITMFRGHAPVSGYVVPQDLDRRRQLCASPSALFSRLDRVDGGCLHVARVNPLVEGERPPFEYSVHFEGRKGAPPSFVVPASARPRTYYEVYYGRYSASHTSGKPRFLAVTFLMPIRAFAGDFAALSWAAQVAEQMRRLADGSTPEAVIPPTDR